MSHMKTGFYGAKVLDFALTASHARKMSTLELYGAIRDCMDCVKQNIDSGYYSDEASVYRQELSRRVTHTMKAI